MIKYLLITVTLFFTYHSFAQTQEEVPRHTLLGNWRTFGMATLNEKDYSDHVALATGLSAGYSFRYKQWGFKIVGYSSINVGLQDLGQPDLSTGRISRYELGLFNVNDPEQKAIGNLGELQLEYRSEIHHFRIGRMKFKSSFLNGQDGRMIPTMFQGIDYTLSIDPIKVRAAIFNKVWARSTQEWAFIGQSIGQYPLGRSIEGGTSAYKDALPRSLIVYGGFEWNSPQGINLTLHNYFVDQLFNTTHLISGYTRKNLYFQAEYLHQNQVGNGGSDLMSEKYFQTNHSDLFGFKWGVRVNKNDIFVAYNRITGAGRMLFPREWGRENIFTFQKRERSEGSSDTHSILIGWNTHYSVKSMKINQQLSFGRKIQSSETGPFYSKYNLPTYNQINTDFFLSTEKWKRLKGELLLAYKFNLTDDPAQQSYNKVDMLNINLVLNYSLNQSLKRKK